MTDDYEIYKSRCFELQADKTLDIFEFEGVIFKTNVLDMDENIKIKYIESFRKMELPNTLKNLYVIDEKMDDYMIYIDTIEYPFGTKETK